MLDEVKIKVLDAISAGKRERWKPGIKVIIEPHKDLELFKVCMAGNPSRCIFVNSSYGDELAASAELR